MGSPGVGVASSICPLPAGSPPVPNCWSPVLGQELVTLLPRGALKPLKITDPTL